MNTKSNEYEASFEAYRESKGGWPSRSECFEEWFLPQLLLKDTQKEEAVREVKEMFEQSHAKLQKNCPRHPQGAGGCSFCNTSSLLKVAYGETLRQITHLESELTV